MSNEMLSKIRKLSAVVQNIKVIDNKAFNDIIREFAHLTESNTALIQKSGKLTAFYSPMDLKPVFVTKTTAKESYIETSLNDQLGTIYETKENTPLSGLCIKDVNTSEPTKHKAVITPIMISGERIAVLLAYKETEFTGDEVALAELVSVISALYSSYSQNEEAAKASRMKDTVKSALGTLSYSELEAIVHVFGELNAFEGLLVASKVADKVGITRSVIVNALRKFESAGIIESRSLGMKGTYIKVINKYIVEELGKIK